MIAPVYRPNLDDAPRRVAVMARAFDPGTHPVAHSPPRATAPRDERHHAGGDGASAWIVPPVRALWLPPELPHSVTMRSRVEMRTVYIAPSDCGALPKQPVLVEISGLLRELILALLDEPASLRRKQPRRHIARLILTELAG